MRSSTVGSRAKLLSRVQKTEACQEFVCILQRLTMALGSSLYYYQGTPSPTFSGFWPCWPHTCNCLIALPSTLTLSLCINLASLLAKGREPPPYLFPAPTPGASVQGCFSILSSVVRDGLGGGEGKWKAGDFAASNVFVESEVGTANLPVIRSWSNFPSPALVNVPIGVNGFKGRRGERVH